MYIIDVAPHYRIGLNDELCTMNVNAQLVKAKQILVSQQNLLSL